MTLAASRFADLNDRKMALDRKNDWETVLHEFC